MSNSKIQRIQENIHNLNEDVDALYKQLDGETNEASRKRIKRNIKHVEEEIEEAESDLANAQTSLLSSLALPEKAAKGILDTPSPDQHYAPNPFCDRGRIEDPTRFFNREPLLHRIFEDLSKGVSLSLVGEAQVGKSSLLSMIAALGAEQLPQPPDAFIAIDMQVIHDENDFFDALCYELEIETCRGFKLARQLRGKRYIVCLDEIEKMKKDRFSGDEREELRGLADGSNAPLTLVVASRVPLNKLFPDAEGKTSPLANICTPVDVLPFSHPIAHDFLQTRLEGTGMSFSEQQREQLIATTGGHPARLQQAAAELYRQLAGG